MVESGKSVSDIKKMFEQNIATQIQPPTLKPAPKKIDTNWQKNDSPTNNTNLFPSLKPAPKKLEEQATIPGKLQSPFLQNQEPQQPPLIKQQTLPPKKLVSPFLNNQDEDSSKEGKIIPKKLVNPFENQQNEQKNIVEPTKKLESPFLQQPVQAPPKVVFTPQKDPEPQVKKIAEPPKKLESPLLQQPVQAPTKIVIEQTKESDVKWTAPKKLVNPFENQQQSEPEVKKIAQPPKKLESPFLQQPVQAPTKVLSAPQKNPEPEVKKIVEPPKKLESPFLQQPVQAPTKIVVEQTKEPDVKWTAPKKLVNPFENYQQSAPEVLKPVDQPKKLTSPFLQQDPQPTPVSIENNELTKKLEKALVKEDNNDKPPQKPVIVKHANTGNWMRRHSSDEEDKKPEVKPQPKKLDPVQLKQAETLVKVQQPQSQSNDQQQDFKNSLELLLAKQRANPNTRRQTTLDVPAVEKEKIKMSIFHDDDEEENDVHTFVFKPVINKKRVATVKYNLENFDF